MHPDPVQDTLCVATSVASGECLQLGHGHALTNRLLEGHVVVVPLRVAPQVCSVVDDHRVAQLRRNSNEGHRTSIPCAGNAPCIGGLRGDALVLGEGVRQALRKSRNSLPMKPYDSNARGMNLAVMLQRVHLDVLDAARMGRPLRGSSRRLH